MTSWVWMKGVAVAFADPPIDPVNDRDNRPAVKDLITKHRKAIDQVKEAVKSDPLYDPTKHDDLWLVRFVLSHKKKTKDAISAALETLAFRAEHKVDEKDIRWIDPVGPDGTSVSLRRYLTYCEDGALKFSVPDPQLGVVAFFNIGKTDQHALAENVDESDWLPGYLYTSEWQFQWLDYITRTTGRLTKAVRIIELAEMTLKGMNRECSKRDTAAMGALENIYPQQLQTIFMCNSPAFIQVPWRVFRPIIPKRVVSKIDFVNPLKNSKEKNRLLEFVDEEYLPERFGGKYTIWPVAYFVSKEKM